MSQHTPGPWDWVQFFAPTGETTYLIRGKGLLEVARVQGFGPEVEANIRLIAAAPRMYGLLKELLDKEMLSVAAMDAIEACVEDIAKARGDA